MIVPENVDYHSYMHWNFEQFGNEHCDENLGALHLGGKPDSILCNRWRRKEKFSRVKTCKYILDLGRLCKA